MHERKDRVELRTIHCTSGDLKLCFDTTPSKLFHLGHLFMACVREREYEYNTLTKISVRIIKKNKVDIRLEFEVKSSYLHSQSKRVYIMKHFVEKRMVFILVRFASA